MHVLENTVGQQFPTPRYGNAVRLIPTERTILIKNLALPTDWLSATDGALYISILGFGPPASEPKGPGLVLRFTGI